MKSVLAYVVFALPVWAATGSNVAVDGQGNIWRTGQSLPVPLTANAFQKTEVESFCATQQISPFQPITFLDCAHAYVTKQDPNGNVLYATYLGGSGEDGGIASAASIGRGRFPLCPAFCGYAARTWRTYFSWPRLSFSIAPQTAQRSLTVQPLTEASLFTRRTTVGEIVGT